MGSPLPSLARREVKRHISLGVCKQYSGLMNRVSRETTTETPACLYIASEVDI